jgi:hypothetical protein
MPLKKKFGGGLVMATELSAADPSRELNMQWIT